MIQTSEINRLQSLRRGAQRWSFIVVGALAGTVIWLAVAVAVAASALGLVGFA